jgi:ADP-ribosylglycohydrolase
MRVGPLGAFHYADMDKLLATVIESCLLTTRDPR